MKPVQAGFADDDESEEARLRRILGFQLSPEKLKKLGNNISFDANENSMRVLSSEATSELNLLLQHVGQQESVIGSLIIGHDGLLIANTLPPEFDPQLIGELALGIYQCTTTAINKLGHEHLYQFVGKNSKGYVVIADFGGGLLVTISDGATTDRLVPMMRSITQLVAQS